MGVVRGWEVWAQRRVQPHACGTFPPGAAAPLHGSTALTCSLLCCAAAAAPSPGLIPAAGAPASQHRGAKLTRLAAAANGQSLAGHIQAVHDLSHGLVVGQCHLQGRVVRRGSSVDSGLVDGLVSGRMGLMSGWVRGKASIVACRHHEQASTPALGLPSCSRCISAPTIHARTPGHTPFHTLYAPPTAPAGDTWHPAP